MGQWLMLIAMLTVFTFIAIFPLLLTVHQKREMAKIRQRYLNSIPDQQQAAKVWEQEELQELAFDLDATDHGNVIVHETLQ